MSLPIDPLYSLSGLCVGFLVGMTGVGGGSLMTPLLVLLFGVAPASAVGTDLLYAAVTKGVGTVVHGLKGAVDWRITGRLAAGSIPAALVTLWWLYRRGAAGHAAHGGLIEMVLGVALLTTSLALLFRPQLATYAARRNAATQRPADAKPGSSGAVRTVVATVAVGAVLGTLVSLTSVGAGAVGVTALLMLYPKLPTGRIVASDIAHAVPLTLIAGSGHWLMGSVDWHILTSLLVGSVPGIVAGSRLSARAPEVLLRYLLALILAIVGARLVFV
ncbi:sulfite exporter TauE/SafE family protein [Chitinasiproducens palmae]|uniref:Probable membrane transporter protein n=1 Tax=Chitinasiproducens palmae TaxID=1770053 RepID=A0A1H2PVW0_9BURK|nr:sulfite exporter TauE/SafE family protein [Chitinasiproducens palmae]SDV51500.1 hypothetical protein SAMN05216551_1188 [Chitinasiproducens palmae]